MEIWSPQEHPKRLLINPAKHFQRVIFRLPAINGLIFSNGLTIPKPCQKTSGFRIIRMGRLIQKDRKLTKNQQDQVREILSLVNALGFQAR